MTAPSEGFFFAVYMSCTDSLLSVLVLDCRHQVGVVLDAQHPNVAHARCKPDVLRRELPRRHDRPYSIHLVVSEVYASLLTREAAFFQRVLDVGVSVRRTVSRVGLGQGVRVQVERDCVLCHAHRPFPVSP